MDGIGNDRRDLVRSIYEQHRAHIRHVEYGRQWFTLVFAIVFTGALAIMGDRMRDIDHWPLVAFLMIFSLFGFFVSLSVQNTLKAYYDAADLIPGRHDLKHYLPKFRSNLCHRMLDVSRLILIFYLFCFSFSLFVLLRMRFNEAWKSGWVPLVIFIVALQFMILWKGKEPAQPDEE